VPSPRPFDALGGVPGAHLGLEWSGIIPADTDSIVALARRCEDVDAARVRVPRVVLERVLTGSPADSVSMVGRDRGGVPRACASVRLAPGGGEVAVRALIDPTWRGRGVGRAVLAWQDRWARHFVEASSPSTVAVPIAASLIDRRRLYTAAGFSCRARIELYSQDLTEAPRDSIVPDWTFRSLAPTDIAVLEECGEPDRQAFVAAAMSRAELLETCDPGLSHVAEHDGVACAAVLVHPTVDSRDRPVGWIRGLIAGPGSEGVQRELVGYVLRSMLASGLRHAHVYATPAVSVLWREALMGLAFVPVDVELLYSIEQP
jgi:GNAT superfamily N-acetyltransferase